ncbi:hypothetical protein GPALN_011638 [Globodera pallida]|uniref:Uncharacterized protein n=1 Tax=Globodera pallida TaxID=36090 RepID=A0A183BZ16_GLOPA|nr:hypothetical protein GPALN_011638 [Globodera pallida]
MSKFCVNLVPLLMLLLFIFVVPAIDGKSGGESKMGGADGLKKCRDSKVGIPKVGIPKTGIPTIPGGDGGNANLAEQFGGLTIDGGDFDNERLGRMLDQALDISTKLMDQINDVQQQKGAAGGCSAGHA